MEKGEQDSQQEIFRLSVMNLNISDEIVALFEAALSVNAIKMDPVLASHILNRWKEFNARSLDLRTTMQNFNDRMSASTLRNLQALLNSPTFIRANDVLARDAQFIKEKCDEVGFNISDYFDLYETFVSNISIIGGEFFDRDFPVKASLMDGHQELNHFPSEEMLEMLRQIQPIDAYSPNSNTGNLIDPTDQSFAIKTAHDAQAGISTALEFLEKISENFDISEDVGIVLKASWEKLYVKCGEAVEFAVNGSTELLIKRIIDARSIFLSTDFIFFNKDLVNQISTLIANNKKDKYTLALNYFNNYQATINNINLLISNFIPEISHIDTELIPSLVNIFPVGNLPPEMPLRDSASAAAFGVSEIAIRDLERMLPKQVPDAIEFEIEGDVITVARRTGVPLAGR